jgi:hypothetical protein
MFMKLKDLGLLDENIAQTALSSASYNHYLQRWGGGTNPNRIGDGGYSTVTDDPSDPHMVRKYGHNPMHPDNEKPRRRDGFEVFIQYLIDHDLMDNNHFPKVYVNKKITDKSGAYINKFQVERLIEGSDLSIQERAFVEEQNFEPTVLSAFDDDEIIDGMAACIENAIHNPARGKRTLKSESLLEACHIIADIMLDSGARSDVHQANIMFRRTPYGVQLVINDPLTF